MDILEALEENQEEAIADDLVARLHWKLISMLALVCM